MRDVGARGKGAWKEKDVGDGGARGEQRRRGAWEDIEVWQRRTATCIHNEVRRRRRRALDGEQERESAAASQDRECGRQREQERAWAQVREQ